METNQLSLVFAAPPKPEFLDFPFRAVAPALNLASLPPQFRRTPKSAPRRDVANLSPQRR